jgi:hypothetical protein
MNLRDGTLGALGWNGDGIVSRSAGDAAHPGILSFAGTRLHLGASPAFPRNATFALRWTLRRSGTLGQIRVGVLSIPSDHLSGYAMEIRQFANGPRWAAVVWNADRVGTSIDTGVAASDTEFQTLGIERNPATGSIDYLVDGQVRASIPDEGADATPVNVALQSFNATILSDYVSVCFKSASR